MSIMHIGNQHFWVVQGIFKGCKGTNLGATAYLTMHILKYQLLSVVFFLDFWGKAINKLGRRYQHLQAPVAKRPCVDWTLTHTQIHRSYSLDTLADQKWEMAPLHHCYSNPPLLGAAPLVVYFLLRSGSLIAAHKLGTIRVNGDVER